MNNNDVSVISLSELSPPKEYYSISIPKINIASAIKNELETQGKSIRKLSEEVGMKHPQILRITGIENYNINTLLKVLDGLGLKIQVQKRE